jgi:hypothetical protein
MLLARRGDDEASKAAEPAAVDGLRPRQARSERDQNFTLKDPK